MNYWRQKTLRSKTSVGIIYFQWWPALSSAVIEFCAIKIGNKSLTLSCAAGKKAALTGEGSGTLK